MRCTFTLLFFCLFIPFGFCQLSFENKTRVPLQVALGYYAENDDYSGWVTEGWFELKPGELRKAITKSLDNQFYYYYATSADSSVEFTGEVLLRVNKVPFKIKDADQNASVAKDNCKYFKTIDTNNKDNFRVVLHANY